jgi:glycosyltransferase involved in cell wall biosynthesis
MPAAAPVVSVVIPAYNCADYVAQAVASALAQTFRDLEILVVDDGSTDDPLGALAPYAGRIHLIRQARRGLPGARNAGICASRGQYVAFLDADDIWLPELLELEVEAARRHPDAGLVYADFSVFSEAGVRTPSRLGHAPRAVAWLQRFAVAGDCFVRGPMYRELLYGNWISASSVLVSRRTLDEYGLFDESLSRGEDYDMWLRLTSDRSAVCVNRVLSGYRFREQSLSGPIDSRWLVWHASDANVLEKHIRLELVPHELLGEAKDCVVRRYREAGWAHLEERRRTQLRVVAVRGLRHRPLDRALWLFALLSCLPWWVVQGMRGVRARVRSHWKRSK